MQISKEEAEFQEMRRKRDEAHRAGERFAANFDIKNHVALNLKGEWEDKMMAHPHWKEWSDKNRDQALDMDVRAKERARQREAEKSREGDRRQEPERGRDDPSRDR